MLGVSFFCVVAAGGEADAKPPYHLSGCSHIQEERDRSGSIFFKKVKKYEKMHHVLEVTTLLYYENAIIFITHYAREPDRHRVSDVLGFFALSEVSFVCFGFVMVLVFTNRILIFRK